MATHHASGSCSAPPPGKNRNPTGSDTLATIRPSEEARRPWDRLFPGRRRARRLPGSIALRTRRARSQLAPLPQPNAVSAGRLWPMPPSPGLFRALSVVVMVATLTSCATLSHRRAASKLPLHFVGRRSTLCLTGVELDDGELVVVPPGKVRAHVSASAARSMFDAADVVDGAYPFAVIGLGVVTISSELTTTTSSQPSAESTTIPSTGTGTPTRAPGRARRRRRRRRRACLPSPRL